MESVDLFFMKITSTKILAKLTLIGIFSLMYFCVEAREEEVEAEIGKKVAMQVVELVEKNGLAPKKQSDFLYAKNQLLSNFEDSSKFVSKEKIYSDIQSLLDTTDSDGHSRILSSIQLNSRFIATPTASLSDGKFYKIIKTEQGDVLSFTLPQTRDYRLEAQRKYISNVMAELKKGIAEWRPCAIVLDFTEQKGGSAAAPLLVLEPFLSENNSAKFVKNRGERLALVDLPTLRKQYTYVAAEFPNELKRFADGPIAVVSGARTASAGEMLEMAMLGEERRAKSFGWKTAGYTTANKNYSLIDGGTLVLSETRYALGDRPPIIGGIQPLETASSTDSLEMVLERAASWAAHHSALCTQNFAADKPKQ
ncbi:MULTISPECIES: S41 family peptidase [unclassified Duganella]|uniref:S41 family peptidase n=1 Tax=unclassified Duganella TaxID=2636909 RepID=UPI00131490AE|nr:MULTISPECIES: S41 family peptidase [unclassified Duganella]